MGSRKPGSEISHTYLKSADGEIIGVRGHGDDFQKNLDQLALGLKRKGKQLHTGQRSTIQNPTIDVSLDINHAILNLELLKIAYLSTVWFFGDEAIASCSGENYRNAINGMEPEKFEIYGVEHYAGLPPEFDFEIGADAIRLFVRP
ncbi:hypothetical protein [Pseudomonas japonica]|uniref:hypothetical protein n=1 Tax=Pseudomonas japonica TaxID=256466 RepID=UPI0015E44988|nr:hypothetical protein [Pseudomonas japonica]MBA1288583.1 hypothetical protein [Pseudomonas japonica]